MQVHDSLHGLCYLINLHGFNADMYNIKLIIYYMYIHQYIADYDLFQNIGFTPQALNNPITFAINMHTCTGHPKIIVPKMINHVMGHIYLPYFWHVGKEI